MNKKNGIVIAAGLVVVAVALGVYESSGSGSATPSSTTPKIYYSDDDGKTIFADELGKLTPFDHAGKQAVEADCFSKDGGKTYFVGYLRSYTEQGKKDMERLRAAKDADPMSYSRVETSETQVKRPGDKTWTPASETAKYREVVGAYNDVMPYTP